MSQTPHPHDPYGTEPGSASPEQQSPGWTAAPQDAPAPQGDPEQQSFPEQDQGSPTSDPALHPHDPYAYDDSTGQAPADQGFSASAPSAGQDPYGAPAGAPGPQDQAGPQSPYGPPGQQGQQGQPGQQAAPGPTDASQGSYDPLAIDDPQGTYGAQGAPGPQGSYGPQGAYGPQGSYGGPEGYAAPGVVDLNTPPPGFKGIYDGPLSGQGMNDSDAKTWALVVHLAALLQFVIPFIGGLIAQIVLFVVFKDRHRFVRYNAAEALNGTIAALIVSLVMGVLFTIITIVTFGIGAVLFGLMFVPTVVQAIFAIIGAVKAYQGEWWNYPVNLRMFR